MLKRIIFLPLFILACGFIHGQNRFAIRLLANQKVSSLIVSPLSADYNIYCDGRLLNDIDPGSVLEVVQEGDSLRLKTLERTLGKYTGIKLISKNPSCSFKLKAVSPETKVHTYTDNLDMTVTGKAIRVINIVDVEDYIAGVVEAESGTKTIPEYYKLQAILCRTYALSHGRRHEPEGFELCDQVHCQAFKGRTVDNDILNAVEDTRGLVIVDSDLNLITAAFHSNCGGQTVNSEDVWALPAPYLKSVKDTFCLKMPHAHWERKIATEDWMSYLALKHKYPVEDSVSFINAVNYPQDSRGIYICDKGLKIPLKTVRADWQLKSTYFSIEQRSDSVIFKGKGYGHGVGLCQEGAMRMARLGYSYKDILHFYYKDVHLVDLSVLEFFRKE
jgi:stage II sporulation protein D